MFGRRKTNRAAEIMEALGGLDLLNTIIKEIRSMKLDFSALQAVVTGIQTDVATMSADMAKVLSMIGNVGAASETDQAQLDQVTAALKDIKAKLDGTNTDMAAAIAATSAPMPPANPAPAAAGGIAAMASTSAVDTGLATATAAPVTAPAPSTPAS